MGNRGNDASAAGKFFPVPEAAIASLNPAGGPAHCLPMILGITGGLGCGKTTAAKLFEARGFRRLDSDAIVRDQVLTDPEVIAELRSHFGPSVFDAQGGVDRPALAGRIFTDDAERIWLEGLTHPRVFAIWRGALRADPGSNWAVEVPLLFEKSLENWFDFIVCVACPHQKQLARLEQRGLNRTFAEQRISKQLPLAEKSSSPILSFGTKAPLEFLREQVYRLVDSLAR